MKVGDIVELSAYGKKMDYLKWLRQHSVGLVTERSLHGYGGWRVLWYGATRIEGNNRQMRMDRKCLKHAKVGE
jgi:hypothetical protein